MDEESHVKFDLNEAGFSFVDNSTKKAYLCDQHFTALYKYTSA